MYIFVLIAVLLWFACHSQKGDNLWASNFNSSTIQYNGSNSYSWTACPHATGYYLQNLNGSGNPTGYMSFQFDGSNPVGPTLTVAPDVFQIYAFETSVLRVTALRRNGSITIQMAPCFLAGSLVDTLQGHKLIEDIVIGDTVIGAFGELNTVLALHRPLLGPNTMVRINGHATTSHHPHVGLDRNFYCCDPGRLDTQTYGRSHQVITTSGPSEMFLKGLAPGRVQQLELGHILKTIGGSAVVERIEPIDMTPETQLYNLVVSGSHTYHVDGYAVTGWPNEDDFDYTTWSAL